jgi:GDP-mannose 6-dehydrogenase
MRETIGEVMDHAEVIVIGNGAAEFTQVPGLLREGQKVIDLVRIKGDFGSSAQYSGICW